MAPVAAGETTLVKRIAPGEIAGISYRGLTNVAGTLYFELYGQDDAAPSAGLWISDGSPAGTKILKSLEDASGFAPLGGETLFSATKRVAPEERDIELWKTDGTTPGTKLVKDIYPGECLVDFGDRYGSDVRLVPCSSDPGAKTRYGDALYFRARNEAGRGLWKCDGTSAGTTLVKRGMQSAVPVKFRGRLYFSGRGRDGKRNTGLWKSDGTTAGTTLVKEIGSGSACCARHLTKVRGKLFFEAYKPSTGWELFVSDGTRRGTHLVKDIHPGRDGSRISHLTRVRRLLYFVADDGKRGPELWRSDGTRRGTRRVSDVRRGRLGSQISGLINVGGTLFFSAVSNDKKGNELWKSDGTARGTKRVRDIRRGFRSSAPKGLTNVGGTLYFSADGGNRGRELWKSDGTYRGTRRVADVWPGEKSSRPWSITPMRGDVYFFADDFGDGYPLWRYAP